MPRIESLEKIKKYLGRILARSANICEENENSLKVRKILEECKNDYASGAYEIELYNSRGFHVINVGSEEKEIADKLMIQSNSIRNTYLETSKIIKKLAESYKRESDENKRKNLIKNIRSN